MKINQRTMMAAMALHSLRRNPRVSVWAFVTLAICAALVTLFTTVNSEIRAAMSGALTELGPNAVAHPVAGGAADWTAFEEIALGAGADFVRMNVRAGMIRGKPVAVVAADPEALENITPYWSLTGSRARAAGECLIGRRVAESIGAVPGDSIEISWPEENAGASLTVSGILDAGDADDERIFIVDSDVPADFEYALLSLPSGETGIREVKKELAAASAQVDVKPLRQVLHGESRILEKVGSLGFAASCAVMVLTALGVSASMLARVVERRKEFALLYALGAHARSVTNLLLMESVAVGGAAAVAGFGVGTALAIAVIQSIFGVWIAPGAMAFLFALVTTTVVALLAGMIASRRASRLNPAIVLKGE